jgi:hypothetical protein
MKIEVNLSGIFNDEDGNEVNDTIKDEIISTVTDKIYRGVEKQIEKTVNDILNKGITERLHAHLDLIIPQLMDFEFTEVTSWGEKKGTYTVKNKLLNTLDKITEYKQTSYSSDRNIFTTAVDGCVNEKLAQFKKSYDNLVNEKFVNEVFKYAQTKLQETLGVKG